MPKASAVQRQQFGRALGAAMRQRRRSLNLDDGERMDDWLGRQVGLTSQAIRNYTTAQREPRSATIVEAIEDALEVPRHRLGTFLGYGPPPMSMSPELLDQLGSIEAMARDHPGEGGFNVAGWLVQARWQIADLTARVQLLEEAVGVSPFESPVLRAAEGGTTKSKKDARDTQHPPVQSFDPDGP